MTHNNVYISITIPVVFLLEHTMHGIIDWTFEAQQPEEEENWCLRAYFILIHTPVWPQQAQKENNEQEE